jgi:hypothetical protein
MLPLSLGNVSALPDEAGGFVLSDVPARQARRSHVGTTHGRRAGSGNRRCVTSMTK